MSMKRRTFLGRIGAAAGAVVVGAKAIASLIPERKGDWFIDEIKLTRNEHPVKLEMRFVHPDGKIRTHVMDITIGGEPLDERDLPTVTAQPDGSALFTWD